MRRRGEHGFSLLEALITLVVFGVVTSILLALTAEMRGYDKRYPINLMKHPQVSSVLSRMRKDVLDAFGPDPYPASYMMHSQSSSKLIVYSVQESGFAHTIVWDFSAPGSVRRQAYSVGGVVTDWTAHGVPASFEVTTFEIPDRPYAVRLKATDQTGRLAIDQILQPRAHN